MPRVAHVCLTLDPLKEITLAADEFLIGDGDEVMLYKNGELVGYVPNAQFVYLEGDPDPDDGDEDDDEEDDDEEDDDEEDESDEDSVELVSVLAQSPNGSAPVSVIDPEPL